MLEKQDRINILCASDDNYVPWCGIMLTSLFESNPGECFGVYFLTAGLTPENTSALQKLEEKYPVKLSFVHVDESMLESCSIREGSYFSLATYYRLLAPRVLPPDVEKVIYLDCDIVVNGPVRPLWESDIEAKAFGAIMDESFYQDDFYRRLQYPKEEGYVNAGVLLINLKYWREKAGMERCMSFLLRNQEVLTFYDQDVLNKVFFAEKEILNLTYNFQNGFLLWWQYGYYQGEMKKEIDAYTMNPVIIHFDGSSKPWHKDCHHPYASFFRYYKEHSLWRETPLVGRYSLKDRLKWIGYNLYVLLGLRKAMFRIPNQKKHPKQ